jgi:hypothetical protein
MESDDVFPAPGVSLKDPIKFCVSELFALFAKTNPIATHANV